MQYNAPVIFIVVNNNMYGTIRMHQEREYPEHVSGTELRNPDFAALARAYGAEGLTVRSLEGFQSAVEAARTGTGSPWRRLLRQPAQQQALSARPVRRQVPQPAR